MRNMAADIDNNHPNDDISNNTNYYQSGQSFLTIVNHKNVRFWIFVEPPQLTELDG